MEATFRFEALVDIHDVKRIVNWSEQGWHIVRVDECLSDMIVMEKTEKVDTGYYTPGMYAKSVNLISNGYFHITEYYYKDENGNDRDFKLNADGVFTEDK